MPSPREPASIRLCKHLDGPLPPALFPPGFTLRSGLTPDDAPALHALLADVFDDGSDGPFDAWWPRLLADSEYEPQLVFLVNSPNGELAGAALCWNTAFVKDLAVRPSARRNGLGRALMLHVFSVFAARGAPYVDLKTSLEANADAVRLYRSLGMVEVDWDG